MEVSVSIVDDNDKRVYTNIDSAKFQKMVLLFNSLEEGWTVKKRSDTYVFTKKHEGKKEVLEDAYLLKFMKKHLDLSNIIEAK
jgi:hypothetical protein